VLSPRLTPALMRERLNEPRREVWPSLAWLSRRARPQRRR